MTRDAAPADHTTADHTTAGIPDVLDLLDDLTRLVHRAADGRDPNQRYHADHVTARLRDLRMRVAGPRPRPARRIPGDWFTDLSLALGDTTDLPRTALVARLDQLETALDRARSRRSRWWRR